MLCLNMVLDTLSVAEEAEALHLIVSHAGERLYDRVPLEDFLASLQTHVAQFDTEGTSVLGKDRDAALASVHEHVDVRPAFSIPSIQTR